MALIDELLKQVDDEALRLHLTKEVETLRERMEFGLVFERHIPEIAVVTSARVRPGNTVRRRDRPSDDTDYVVESVNARRATIRPKRHGGPIQNLPIGQLAAVKPFGEPIFPGLHSVGRVVRGGERPFHTVINAENFHALQLLLIFGEGSVDCIYIDPPYNTGARDWKYNNAYVDANDAWRHSKWLSMMEKRLKLAKRLLKPDGVLVVAIDEHELHHLGMLLEEVFPEYLRYVVSIVVNARGSTGTRNFGVVEEQALFVVPDLGYDVISPREAFVPSADLGSFGQAALERAVSALLEALPDLRDRLENSVDTLDDEDAQLLRQLLHRPAGAKETSSAVDDDVELTRPSNEYWRGAMRTGQGTSFREQRPKQFYPIYINPQTRDLVRVGPPLLDRDPERKFRRPQWDLVDGLVPIWPVDEEGRERVWCFEPGRMEREIKAGNLQVGRFNPRRNTYALNVRRLRRTEQRFREITVWWEKSYDSGSNGTNMLKNLLGESGAFPFPKSLYNVRDVLATVVGRRPNAVILDFFAGSGTTLHATCLLNAIDGGSRRCILVTNNEVDLETAEKLAGQGAFPGDREYEQYGIFNRVTVPRVRAAIEGQRANGKALAGRYKWAGGRPLANGFEENVEFLEFSYLDADDVELDRQFAQIAPVLWLAAGARCELPPLKASANGFVINLDSSCAVLFDDSKLHKFAETLAVNPAVQYVFHITNSPDAYSELLGMIGPERHAWMLYNDFLVSCRANVGIA